VSIGVVVTFPDPLTERVRRIQRAYGSETADIPPHITVLSLDSSRSDVCPPTENGWARAREHVAEVAQACTPFRVSLGEARCFWPASPVAYLSVLEGARQLEDLAARVASGPLAHEPTFPYVPHVTLVYPAEPAVLFQAVRDHADFKDAFVVDSIGLYQQNPSARWVHREEIPLGNSPQTAQ
jgi:2'-5' RNA ligase